MKHPFTKIGSRTKRPKTTTAAQSTTKKFPKRLSFGLSVLIVLILSLGLLGASGYYWYKNVLTDPARTMSDVLNKSLQTTSLTRSIEQKSDQSTVNQSVYVSFSPKVVARSVTNLEESSTLGNSKVQTETIGTNDTDLVRYDSIDVSSQASAKQSFDTVINTWGKRQNNKQADPQQQTAEQPVSFLNDALFVAVPFGNLNAEQRKELTNEIKTVKLYDTSKTEKSFDGVRPIMTYTMNVDPQALVQVLAKYVQITGVGSAADLDPAQYEGASKIQVSMQVDLLSRHIKQIKFGDSGRTENYGAYNIKHDVALPSQTVDIDELQNRLSAIEQKYQDSSAQTTPQQ